MRNGLNEPRDDFIGTRVKQSPSDSFLLELRILGS